MENINCGILYISLYSLLKKRYGVGIPIRKKDFFCEIGRHFLVPKNLKNVVVKEMELRKMILREDRNTIKLLKIDIDLDRDANKLYELVGLL